MLACTLQISLVAMAECVILRLFAHGKLGLELCPRVWLHVYVMYMMSSDEDLWTVVDMHRSLLAY